MYVKTGYWKPGYAVGDDPGAVRCVAQTFLVNRVEIAVGVNTDVKITTKLVNATDLTVLPRR